MRQSFNVVVEVCYGAAIVGLMGLVVRHEAQQWSRTAVGMPKVALATINLHVEAHWYLSGTWELGPHCSRPLNLPEFKSHYVYVHDAFRNQSLRLYLLRKLSNPALWPSDIILSGIT